MLLWLVVMVNVNLECFGSCLPLITRARARHMVGCVVRGGVGAFLRGAPRGGTGGTHALPALA